MKFLLTTISLLFWYIFYFFSSINSKWINIISSKKESIYYLDSFFDLKITSLVFFWLWALFFLYFSDFSRLKIWDNIKIDYRQIPSNIVKFCKNYLYYIWFILFYFALYFILKDFTFFQPSLFIFVLNLVIIILFFITNRFFIFKDFIKINTILFSLYYIFYYIYYSYLLINLFTPLDLLNQISVLSFFLLTIYNDKRLLNKDFADSSLIFYFFVYIFWFLYFYLKWFSQSSYLVSLIWFFLSFFIYNFLVKISFFSKNVITLKYLSIIFLYISSIFSIFFSIKYWVSFLILFILFYSFLFNFRIHNRYQNYISLFFSLSSIFFLFYYIFFKYFYIEKSIINLSLFLWLFLLISFLTILFTYFYKIRYFWDYYFYSIFSYIINIFTVSFFFYKSSFDFFTFWVILLFESMFIFLSYYRFKTIKV